MRVNTVLGVACVAALASGAAEAVVLDFEDAPFAPGVVVDDLGPFLVDGVPMTISSSDRTANPVTVFDSRCEGTNPGFEGTVCTGGDPDLASEFPPDPDSTLQTSLDAGQILILSEDPLSVAEANGGIFPDPDDLAGRGDIVFSFDADMELTRFDLFDTEEGNLDVFVDGTKALSDLGVESNGQFLRTALLPPLFGRTFTFSFSGSGALDNLDFRNPELVTSEVPVPAALPFLATGLGVLGWLGWRRRAGA